MLGRADKIQDIYFPGKFRGKHPVDLEETMMFRISFQVNVPTKKLRYKKEELHNREEQTQNKIKLDRKK